MSLKLVRLAFLTLAGGRWATGCRAGGVKLNCMAEDGRLTDGVKLNSGAGKAGEKFLGGAGVRV